MTHGTLELEYSTPTHHSFYAISHQFSPEPLNMLEKYLQSTLKHKLFDLISYTSEKQAEYPGSAAKVQTILCNCSFIIRNAALHLPANPI